MHDAFPGPGLAASDHSRLDKAALIAMPDRLADVMDSSDVMGLA